LKVVLGTLKYKGDELATFLEPRVGAKPSLSGDAIEIDDGEVREGVKPRHVKTYIKRFLYMNKVRKNYRVFVSGRELTIQEIELGEEKEEEEKKPEKKAEAAPVEEAKAEEPEAPEEPEGEAAEEPKAEKPKKAAAKKPRPKKKKAEED
jgi:type IV secretory pathway VirB10-like protein